VVQAWLQAVRIPRGAVFRVIDCGDGVSRERQSDKGVSRGKASCQSHWP